MRSVSNDVCNVAKFFCRNTATLPTQHDPTLFASSALSCVQTYDNKTFFQTVSEIATPFFVGGKACFLFQHYKKHKIMLHFQIMPPTGTVLVCWELHHKCYPITMHAQKVFAKMMQHYAPSQYNSYGLEFKAFSCLLTTYTNFRIRQPT